MSRAKEKLSARKRLIKLLNKELRYEGTYSHKAKHSNSVLIKNVKYKGKLVADHIWVARGLEITKAKKNDNFTFLATAQTYRDSKNIRKYGLERCYRFHYNEEKTSEVKKDNEQKFKRLHKQHK